MNYGKTILGRSVLAGGLILAATGSVSAQEVQVLMGEPLPGLSVSELDRFVKGKVEFEHVLSNAEGLGPVFNDTSCAQCHGKPRVGGAGVVVVKRAGKAGPPFDPLAAKGGSLFQVSSINSPLCDEVIPPEADVFTDRLTPPAFGAGLIESINDADILAIQNNPPSPFVNGIARMVSPVEGGPMRVGKFGWKGGVATMLTFSADASLNEMGLTNRFFTAENAPNGDAATLALCDTVPDPEDGPDAFGFDRIDRQTDFQIFLGAPPQFPRAGMAGETIFNNVGCADCHVGQAFTTVNANEPALNGKSFKPYSDFLLHDMGSLGDRIVDGIATEQLMKTSPLWGISGRAELALLHDGSATGGTADQNLDSAIIAHDGEALNSKNSYLALSQGDKDLLAAFLLSLGRGEFDHQNDVDRDAFDFFFMEQGFTGPGASLSPDDDASISDHDEDGDLDMRDFAAFQRAFTGQSI